MTLTLTKGSEDMARLLKGRLVIDEFDAIMKYVRALESALDAQKNLAKASDQTLIDIGEPEIRQARSERNNNTPIMSSFHKEPF